MNGNRDDRASRRLKEASKYVSRAWLAPDKHIHAKILEKLNRSDSINFDQISQDLRSDFALYSHVMRKIPEVLPCCDKTKSPAALARTLTNQAIKDIFNAPLTEISSHDLSGVKDVQLTRVRHSVISCSTVALLARKTNIDPDFAYSCAMLRQLGHLFVAWNYQSSCLRAAVNACTTEKPFDEELEQILGFKPFDLGFEIAAGWSENPDLQFGVGAYKANGNGSLATISQSANDVLQFCKIGETLAQVNDPQNYPKAASEWKLASQQLTRYLGAKGTALIRDSIEEFFPTYSKLAPSLFPADLSPDRSAKEVNAAYAKQRLESNQYVKRCNDEIRGLLESVYSKVLQAEASMEALSTLISEVVPKAGFISGCVYLLDPHRMMLVPRLKFGNAKDRMFKTISCSCGGERSHPVSEAFQCTTPIKEEHVVLNGDVVSHVTGKFGIGDKVGILYLEFADDPSITIDSDGRLLYFKAIRHCLADCLNVRQ